MLGSLAPNPIQPAVVKAVGSELIESQAILTQIVNADIPADSTCVRSPVSKQNHPCFELLINSPTESFLPRQQKLFSRVKGREQNVQTSLPSLPGVSIDYCNWHRARKLETAGRRTYNQCVRWQPRRLGSYNDPYHESPIDFDKYDNEISAAKSLDKLNATAPCCFGKGQVKRSQHTKKPVQQLATACAANYEIFGHDLSAAVEFPDSRF
ncbi:hypothetical protein GGS21DRAFT_487403 [Xylaria nigripes]|nr:hypothetical protein GGS21DRAFT_487403 [Xylaria nigripes]